MYRIRGVLLCCILLGLSLLLSACSTEPAGPAPTPTPVVSTQEIEDSAREWLAGIAGMDGNKTLKYTCLAQREQVQESSAMGNALSSLMGSLIGMSVEADVTDVRAETLEYTSDRARLQMGGELRVAMGAQGQAFPIGDVWRMIKENDTWRWCGTDSGVMPLSQDALAIAGTAASGPTPTPAPSVTPSGSTIEVDAKETVLIPAGDFQMGCSPDDNECQYIEQPLHTVSLDAYRIDKYEVTNARYKECVDAGACTPPHGTESVSHFIYYDSAAFADFPVINVDWSQADAFCRWDEGRLPSEAEWEKAARGSEDTRIYPWGNDAPDATLLNFDMNVGDTIAVGSYPAGASPYGVMDMSGNVKEWVNDWGQDDYYSVSPPANPQGPATGTYRMLRGSSFGNNSRNVRASPRGVNYPGVWGYGYGFRCVRSQ